MCSFVQKNRNFSDLDKKQREEYKQNLPNLLPTYLFEISIGLILGDATLYLAKKGVTLKFEQGFKNKIYIFHLFEQFKGWTFYKEPYIRKSKRDINLIHSYSFQTFSHPAFQSLWDSLMISEKKRIEKGFITKNLTLIGLAYWIADDGSYHREKKYLVLHTQSFSKEENEILSLELNQKFHLNSKVMRHKKIYWVLYFPPKDVITLKTLLVMPPSMEYKLGNHS